MRDDKKWRRRRKEEERVKAWQMNEKWCEKWNKEHIKSSNVKRFYLIKENEPW